jgi:hypothetical protein
VHAPPPAQVPSRRGAGISIGDIRLNNQMQNWLGQVTTGHGIMVLAPTLLSLASGTISWSVALPLLAAAIVGLVWPENAGLQGAARTIVTDAEALIEAYRTGLQHAAPGARAPVAVPGTPGPLPPPAVTGLAVLAATAIALSACANQTDAEKAAEARAVTSGLMCIVDASGKIGAVTATDAPDAMKAATVATIAAGSLVQDPACIAAMGASVRPVPISAP